MHRHWVIGWVAGPDTGGGIGDKAQRCLAVNDDARMVHGAMLACPVMAGETAGGIDASGNDLLDGDTGGGGRRSGGIVTLGAGVLMEVEDTGPSIATTQFGVADIAGLALGEIDAGPQADCMLDAAAGAMVMAVKAAGVAADAFAGGVQCRAEAEAVD